MKQKKPNHSFKNFILICGGFFLASIFALGYFIADIKGAFTPRNDLVSFNLTDKKFTFSQKDVISITKERDGTLIEANIRLYSSPDPTETGSFITLITKEKPLSGSVLLRQSEGEIDPKDRLALIWQRYLKAVPFEGPQGLEGHIFAPGSPYDGEILFTNPADPRKFSVRCLQATSTDQPEVCLREIRIANGKIDLLIKFPRSWLNEWREIDSVVLGELNAALK